MDARDERHVNDRWRGGVSLFGGVTLARYGITFTTQVLLARLLVPDDFGSLAILMTIVNGCLAIVTLHSDKYLVRIEDGEDAHANAAFTAEFATSTAAFCALWFVGPLILDAMRRQDLVPALRIYSLLLMINPIVAVRGVLLRGLSYRSIYLPLLAGVVVGAAVTIVLALLGWRVWALVIGKVAGQTLEVLIIWSAARPRPRLIGTLRGTRAIFHYGLPLTAASTLVYFYWHVDYVVIDRIAGITALGYYFFAFQLNEYFLQVRMGLNQVSYPILARQSEDDVARLFVRLTWLNALVYLAPTAVLLGGADTVMVVVFGEAWRPAVVPFKLLLILTAWRGMTGHVDSILMLRGRNRTLLTLTLINCMVVPVVVIPLTWGFGVDGAAAGVTLGMLAVSPLLIRALHNELDVQFFWIVQRPLGAFAVTTLGVTVLQAFAPRNLFGCALLLFLGGTLFAGALYALDRTRVASLLRDRRAWLMSGASISDARGVR